MSDTLEKSLPIEPREPKLQWGQAVLAAFNLRNDGSYPDRDTDALLVVRGTRGEIVQVGHHIEANVPVYLVEFPDGCVVGCLEEEIAHV